MRRFLLSFIFQLCALQLLTYSHLSFATNTKVIGIEIPGLHNSSFNGVYDKIIAKAIVDSPSTILENYPPARADAVFAGCTNCCISPSNNNPEFYDYGDEVVTTTPFNIAKIYLFTAPGTEPLTELAQLDGKVIGIRYGMPYGKRFDDANITKFPVSDLREHLSLMELGLIDAFLAYVPDIYNMFQEEGVKPYPHAAEYPYALHLDALSCKGVPSEFIKYFNYQLKIMKENGVLQTLLLQR